MRIFLLYACIVFAVPVLLAGLATFCGLHRSFRLYIIHSVDIPLECRNQYIPYSIYSWTRRGMYEGCREFMESEDVSNQDNPRIDQHPIHKHIYMYTKTTHSRLDDLFKSRSSIIQASPGSHSFASSKLIPSSLKAPVVPKICPRRYFCHACSASWNAS